MKCQLREIVLWPRKQHLSPRRLRFEPGKINVITGASKTGKSAIIPIVDYCLGSDRCAVPVRTIRDSCSWFGVVLDTHDGQKLLARREPDDQQSTGDMFLSEGVVVDIPNTTPEKNTNVDAVKITLDKLAGLSNLSFDPSGLAGGFKQRPSFRDMAAFMFQPQNIVANPDVLFYKADTMEHREKLRTIFPYVLGAMTPELLAMRWEMDQVLRGLRRLEREFSAQSQATERWKAELKAWISEARALGLVPADLRFETLQESELIDVLREVVSQTSEKANVTTTTIEASSHEASELDREESTVALKLGEVRTRLEKLLKLKDTVDDYSDALEKQRERLGLSRWLRELQDGTKCPLCGGDFQHAGNELNLLCDALAEIEASAREISPAPAAFNRELAQMRDETRLYTDQLQAIQLRRRRLEQRSEKVKERALRRTSIDRYLGRVEQALDLFESPIVDDKVSEEIDRLRGRLEELRTELSEAGIHNRTQAALGRVSTFISRMLPSLDTERPNDAVELNIEELTIKVMSTSGRPDHLWEIGSGANWLSYHLTVTLALHKLFSAQTGNPVPGILIYDQPSQVYFPRTLARPSKSGDDPPLRDEDVVAVRKVFEVLSESVKTAKGALQVIVLDHAGQDVWGAIDGVHLVDEWRDGRALVPQEWLA